jgi:hypothetical protein
LSDVREQLLPKLDDAILETRRNFKPSSDDDPESHFYDLKSAFQDYRDHFTSDPQARELLDSALTEIDAIVEEMQEEQPREPDWDDYPGGGSRGESFGESRSVFDDVDH